MSSLRDARDASDRRDWAAAVRLWADEMLRAPDGEESHLRMGQALIESGDLDRAERLIATMLDRFPRNEWVHFQRAQVASRRRDWTLAAARWQAMLSRFPAHLPAGVAWCETLIEQGRYEDAERSLAELASRAPNEPAILAAQALAAKPRAERDSTPERRVLAKIAASGVLGRLPADIRDPEVMIEITSICNFACAYCVSPLKLREKTRMEMDIFRRVMAEVARITTKPILFHVDGEPTSHPDFVEMGLLAHESPHFFP